MLDTRLIDDVTLRCEALFDRVAATPIGKNDHALKVAMAECDVVERGVASPSAVYRVRAARHWLQLAYGGSLHGYPASQLRTIVLDAITDARTAAGGAEARPSI